ncbi:S49 family peptidase [Lujinxingia vulgaris]|nr:S49 family peptidase [Lujinxingia vulgaris]
MLRAPFVIVFNLLRLLRYLWRWLFFKLGRRLARRRQLWVRLNLGTRRAFGPAHGLAARFQRQESYLQLRDDVDRLASSPYVKGVVLVCDDFAEGAARTADLRELILRLRRAGKRVITHTHALTGNDFDLASATDEVLLTPGGRLYLFGRRFEEIFAAELLEKVGVAAQFVHIGPFKTAAHRMIHNHGTPPQRLMMTQLLETLEQERLERQATSLALSPQTLDAAVSHMPLDARRAQAMGLVGPELHRAQLKDYLAMGARNDGFIPHPELATPDGPDERRAETNSTPAERQPVDLRSAEDWLASDPGPFQPTPLFRRRERIAVMDLSGMIVMSSTDIPGQSAASVQPSEVLPTLNALRRDPRVRAVILHINSPGGSALASEILWEAIERLRREKPVIAYCSDVAASGGYYMAVACDRIVCQPETLTGSIGVIAGKLALPGVFENLHLHVEHRERNPVGRFQSLSAPLPERALANLQQDARAFYRMFLRRVGHARQLPRRRLHRYARGRVYTGRDALIRGLVDELGGFDRAFELACELGELSAERADLHFTSHRRVSLPALLRRQVRAELPALSTLDTLRTATALLRQEQLLAICPLRPANASPS